MRCEFVARDLPEDEAHELERFLIAEIGRQTKGGPLVNATDGGEGVSGLVCSEDRPCGRPRPDLVGQSFGRLKVLSLVGPISDTNRQLRWHCICECGRERDVTGGQLKNGLTKSCGCLQRDVAGAYGSRFWLGRN
jgi:hypothetical protein